MTTHQTPKPLAQRDGLDLAPTFASLREEWLRRREARGEDPSLRYLQEELEALTGYRAPRPRLSEWASGKGKSCPLWVVGAMLQILGGSGVKISLSGEVTILGGALGKGKTPIPVYLSEDKEAVLILTSSNRGYVIPVPVRVIVDGVDGVSPMYEGQSSPSRVETRDGMEGRTHIVRETVEDIQATLATLAEREGGEE